MTLIIRTSKAALPKLATICYTFMHSRRLPRFELPLFPSKWRTTLELGNNFSDLFECLSFFLHDSRFFWFRAISASLRVHTVFGPYLFLTIYGSVFVSGVSVSVFASAKNVKTNMASLCSVCFYP
jgi:hypothetical protein